MVKVIMNGCNGKMGQTITGLIAADNEIEIVAGIDAYDEGKNSYPVFTDITKCDIEADAVIDFSTAAAVDALLDYCVEKKTALRALYHGTVRGSACKSRGGINQNGNS